MEKRTIIILVVALILIVILLFIFLQGGAKDKDNLTGQQIKETAQETEDNQERITNPDNSRDGSGGAGSSGASGSRITGEASEGEIQLFTDLYDVECGFYFSEF